MDMAGVHAGFLADAIVRWVGCAADEGTALAEYHRRRNAHGLAAITRPCAAPPICGSYERWISSMTKPSGSST